MEKEEDDDDIPQLSAETLAALNAFQAEQAVRVNEDDVLPEDWQLSQFWYTRETANRITEEILSICDPKTGLIACISCPTLLDSLNSHQKSNGISAVLLEFDERFGRKYPEQFLHYDYRIPQAIPDEFMGKFDVIVADPPFLSDECLVKIAQTIRRLSKGPETRIIICTGIVMEDLIERLFSAKRCKFQPQHVNNLANEFACFANYRTNFL